MPKEIKDFNKKIVNILYLPQGEKKMLMFYTLFFSFGICVCKVKILRNV